jgi:hypothetical protein
MIKISIYEEAFDHEKEPIRIIGKLDARYYIGPWEYENYVEETKQILFEFLCEQNRFPLYITFEPYNDVYGNIVAALEKEDIKYSIKRIQKKRESFPVFDVIVKRPQITQYRF